MDIKALKFKSFVIRCFITIRLTPEAPDNKQVHPYISTCIRELCMSVGLSLCKRKPKHPNPPTCGSEDYGQGASHSVSLVRSAYCSVRYSDLSCRCHLENLPQELEAEIWGTEELELRHLLRLAWSAALRFTRAENGRGKRCPFGRILMENLQLEPHWLLGERFSWKNMLLKSEFHQMVSWNSLNSLVTYVNPALSLKTLYYMRVKLLNSFQ